MAPAPPVAYLTDVEGMWSRLASFARDNPLVSLDAQGRLQVRPDARFVFGGDAIDRGPDAIRLVATLTEAKLRQPDRVFLLAGNRDINKLRLWRELQGEPHPRSPEEVRRDPVALLRWIFQNTMGAGDAFAMRLRELGPRASEADVPPSYLEDLRPEGALTRYLSLCQLALRIGGTLFVHGAVTRENLGVVPDQAAPLAEVDAWVEALNAWYTSQLAAFRARALEPSGTPLWQGVIAYQAPKPGTKLNQASVVYGRLTDDLQNPYLPDREVVQALLRQGVSRVVVGHTPAGDVPSVLRAGGFELVMADNSRGRVDSGTQLAIEGDLLDVRGQTVLDSGERLDLAYRLALPEPSQVGLVDAQSGQLVKGPLSDGRINLWKGLPRYQVEQVAVAPTDLDARALVPSRFGEAP